MLYMKEDDMDEMMRKAAEHYEIDAEKASDWNAVYNVVHNSEASVPTEQRKHKRRFIFWWFLLIPIGWIANTEYNKFKDAQNEVQNKTHSSIEQKIKAQQPIAKNDALINSAGDTSFIANSSKKNDAVLLAKKVLPQINKTSAVNYHLNNQNFDQQFRSATDGPATNQAVVNAPVKTNNNPTTETIANDNQISNTSPAIVQQSDTPALNNIDSSQKQNVTAASKAVIKMPKSNNHYFYAGLIAGADLSFVKYQDAEPLGYNAGLLVGYKLNKLSIESGVYFVKKNYYTNGEYFDKSGISYFDDAKILTVAGYCQMFEIPLNFKYNISEKRRHTWFAGAGLSSYLMNKEFYNYDYIKDGQQRNGSRAYYHATQNWFSILNLNAGYELRTGMKTNLRIEPYYKAPLSGVGTGKLSISSIGINAGIVRRIP